MTRGYLERFVVTSNASWLPRALRGYLEWLVFLELGRQRFDSRRAFLGLRLDVPRFIGALRQRDLASTRQHRQPARCTQLVIIPTKTRQRNMYEYMSRYMYIA